MELEGFGVSLLGKTAWIVPPCPLPWEFLQGYAAQILITAKGHGQMNVVEGDWTSVWYPTQSRDWSCIATVLRSSAGAGPCLLVLDHVDPPANFWLYVDGLLREGRSITRVWVSETAPTAFVADAAFVAPLETALIPGALATLTAAGATGRAGHGAWIPLSEFEVLAEATREQGLGLVLTDLHERTWTLLWHRPADSRHPLEKRVTFMTKWLQAVSSLLGM